MQMNQMMQQMHSTQTQSRSQPRPLLQLCDGRVDDRIDDTAGGPATGMATLVKPEKSGLATIAAGVAPTRAADVAPILAPHTSTIDGIVVAGDADEGVDADVDEMLKNAMAKKTGKKSKTFSSSMLA